MILYHGTDNISAESIIKNGIDLKYGKKYVDNGPGFYLTQKLEFAVRRAQMTTDTLKQFYSAQSIYPAVLEIEFKLPKNDKDIIIKEFAESGYDWKEFVFYNRAGYEFIQENNINTNNHNLDCKFDIVIDETADAGINNIVSAAKNEENIEFLAAYIDLIKKSTKEYWGKQISLHSDKACSYINSMKILS